MTTKKLDNEPWIRQIILDSISINESLPLRIIDIKKFESFKDLFKEALPGEGIGEIKNIIAKCLAGEDKSEIKNKLEKLRKIYAKNSHKIFPTLPANPHTLEFLSQTMVDNWRIYSMLWLYDEIHLNPNTKETRTIKNFYGLDNFTALLTPVNDEEGNNEFFLIGPVFTLEVDDVIDEDKVDQKIIQPVIKKIINFSKSNNTNEHIRRSQLSLAINSKPICDIERLENHVDSIKQSWGLLINAEINLTSTISHKWLRNLAIWSFFVCYKKDISRDNFNISFQSSKKFDCLQAQMQLYAKITDSNTIIGLEQLSDSRLNSEQPHKKDFIKYYTKFNDKSNQYDLEKLQVLDTWLDNQFLILLPSEQETDSYKLSSWICAILRADMSGIYSYHSEEVQSLSVHKIYFRSSDNIEAREKMEKEISSEIIQLDEKKQQQSQIYKTIKCGESQIVLNTGTKSICPTGTTLLPLNTLHSKAPAEKCEIATPIKFNNRLIGVIEVAAFTPWRFRYEQKSLMLSICARLSAYWYQQKQAQCLNKIQIAVSKFHRGDYDQSKADDLYKVVCQQACAIFLCDASSLWMKEQDKFKCISSHNIKKQANLDIKDSFMGEAVEEVRKGVTGKIFTTSVEGEKVKNGKKLETENVKYIMHVPIVNAQFTIILALYDTDTNTEAVGFDKSWALTNQFFANQLQAIIDAVEYATHTSTNIQQLKTHEINGSVGLLVEATDKLVTADILEHVEKIGRMAHYLNNNQKIKNQVLVQQIINDMPKDVSTQALVNTYKELATKYYPASDIKLHAQALQFQMNTITQAHKLTADELSLSLVAGPVYFAWAQSLGLLKQKKENVNIRELLNQIITAKGANTYSSIHGMSSLKVNKAAFRHVVINLWENAQKYSDKNSHLIIFDAKYTPSGGLLFSIANDSKKYSQKELKELTKMGVRHYDENQIKHYNTSQKKMKNSLNMGFGLFLAEMTCKHVLHCGFKISQEPYNIKGKEIAKFVVTISFSNSQVNRSNI